MSIASKTSRIEVAFFSMSNASHFIGAVALLNSLRAVGHDEPFYLLDCGLTDRQRKLLDGHATLIPGSRDISPVMLKNVGPLRVDPDVAVILDADIIVTRPLSDLIGAKPVVFLNDWTWRFEPEWIRLGFGGLRRIPYLNAGQMILPRASGMAPLLQAGNERLLEIVRKEPALCRTTDDPFHWMDQDVLTALVASMDPDEYVISNQVAYWPFERSLDDARMLHHILDKPWLQPRRSNPYTREMVRLLGSGPVEVPPADIPLQLRAGAVGRAARARDAMRHTLREHTRGKLGIRPRIAQWAAR
jgi:hypothetical protein